jgi:Domain of unknown function (DUF5655)
VVSPMWTCAVCGRAFANRNQTHACGPLGDLERLFDGCSPQVRECFDRVLEAARRAGPLTVLPERTRIAFQVRMSFAAFQPRRRWLDGHVVLARELASPRFRRIEVFSARNVRHAFRLHVPAEVDAEVDAEVGAWLAEAYRVGAQEHLR